MGIDHFEHVSKAGRQLEAAYPHRPKAIGNECDIGECQEGQDIDGENPSLKGRISAAKLRP